MSFIEKLSQLPIYPGYPKAKDRAAMSAEQYEEWVKNGRPMGAIPGLYDHPTYLAGVKAGKADVDDGTGTFYMGMYAPTFVRGGYPRDDKGRPVHPYAKDILLAGLGLSGPGAYWAMGPNLCADPLVFGVDKGGVLKVLVIKRKDTGRIALPGGHLDPGEKPLDAAMRELLEETGIDINAYPHITREIWSGPVADARTTLHRWPETTVFAFLACRGEIDKMEPKAGDDAAAAEIVPVDTEFYKRISPSHGEFVHRGVVAFCNEIEYDSSLRSPDFI